MADLTIRVHGTPARQGSKSFKGMRKMHGKQVPVLVEADDNLPDWRTSVIAAAMNAMRAAGGWVPLDDACAADITVYLQRRATVRRAHPTSQSDGDADKYVRAIFDALTYAGVWTNDARVVDHHCRKVYADSRPPGAVITVRPIIEALL